MFVSEKERDPREASEASRSNIPWRMNVSENHAWQKLRVSHQSWPITGIRVKPIPVLDVISEEFRCELPCELL